MSEVCRCGPGEPQREDCPARAQCPGCGVREGEMHEQGCSAIPLTPPDVWAPGSGFGDAPPPDCIECGAGPEEWHEPPGQSGQEFRLQPPLPRAPDRAPPASCSPP